MQPLLSRFGLLAIQKESRAVIQQPLSLLPGQYIGKAPFKHSIWIHRKGFM
jgi:hypothetical protein